MYNRRAEINGIMRNSLVNDGYLINGYVITQNVNYSETIESYNNNYKRARIPKMYCNNAIVNHFKCEELEGIENYSEIAANNVFNIMKNNKGQVFAIYNGDDY